MSRFWWSKGYYGSYWSNSSLSGLGDFDNDLEDLEEDTSFSWRDAYKSRYKSSLGFSSDRLSSTVTSFSGYYSRYRDADEVEKQRVLLERTYRTARDLVIILDFPFKVTFQLSSGGSELEYGWEHRLFIPTGPLDEKEGYTEEQKINLCSAGAIQQAAYLKYTEYNVYENFVKKLNDYRECEGNKVPRSHVAFIKVLLELIELERVENRLLQERPGYLGFVDSFKTYIYGKFIKTKFSESSKVQLFLYNLYRLIRYPEDIQNDILEEFSDAYEKIQKILTPLPDSTKESCKAAFKMYKTILDTFKNDLKLEIGEMDISSILIDIAKLFNLGVVGCLYGFDGDGGKSLREEFIYSGITKDTTSYDGSSILSKLVTGIVEKGEDHTYFEYSRGDRDTYLQVAKEVSPYVASIKKIIKNTDQNYDFNIYGSKSGRLDSNNKLIEAFQGDPNVYVRQGHVRTNKTNVCVLIDESGSMWSKNKCYVARKAAILLNEALKGIPGVELNIFGHTGDTITSGSTEIKVYCQDGMKLDPYALSSISAVNENRDGTAIYQSALRIRKKSKTPGIMIVISDGVPCAHSYWGISAIKDVHDKVKKVESMGFTVIQVSIDTVNEANKMFSHCIDLKNDLSQFPKLLGKVVRKAIVENKKTTIN